MKKFLSASALVLPVALFGLIARAAPQQVASPGAQLTIDQLIDIRHPSNPVWSPDGRHVAFLSERAGIANIYVADAAGPSPSAARALTKYADGQGGGFFWSADSARVYFPRQGDLWQVAAAGGDPSAVWATPQAESNMTLSPNGKSVAFVRSAAAAGATPAPGGRGARGGATGSELVVRSLADGRETVVLRADNGIGAPGWSPDGQSIVFTGGARTIRHEQTPAYSGSKIIYTITENVPGETSIVPAAGGTPKSLGAGGGFGGRRWLDSKHFLAERTSPDFKRRTTSLVDVGGGEPKVLHEEVSDKFWSITGDNGAQPSPDGKWIAFLSDRDGWDHIYVMPATGAGERPQPIQITKGKFETRSPQWSPDSTRIAFDANEPDHYGDRHLYVATIGADPAHATVAAITGGRGTDIAPQWSPDGTRLVYQHTDPHNSADLFVISAAAPAQSSSRNSQNAMRLSDSMPSSIDRAAFVEPEQVSYKGPDGQTVPAWLFVPKGLDKTKKHPAIVWIHGDGVNQG